MQQTYTVNDALDKLTGIHKRSLKEYGRAITEYRARGTENLDDTRNMVNGFLQRGCDSFLQVAGTVPYNPSDGFIKLMYSELLMAHKRLADETVRREEKSFSDYFIHIEKYHDAVEGALNSASSGILSPFADVPLNAPAVEFPSATAAINSVFDSLPEHPEVKVAKANLEAYRRIAEKC